MHSKKKTWLAVAMLVVLAIALRGYRLGHQSLWNDEIDTFISSNAPVMEVISGPPLNTNIPPLYYAIVHFVLPFGTDETLLRLPSLLFGTLSVGLLYAVVGGVLPRNVGLLAAFLAAISPLHVWYSQEARPYALLLFLALLSLWLLQRCLVGPPSRLTRLALCVTAASTFYCHTVALAWLAFLATYVLIVVPRRRWTEWVPTFAAMGLLITPALWFLVRNPPVVSANPHQVFTPLSFVGYTVWAFASGYSLGPSVGDLHAADRMSILASHVTSIIPLMLVVSCLLVIGCYRLWRLDWRASLLVACWLGLPFVFTLLGSIVTIHAFNVRYVILSFPPFLILLAMGIHGAGSRVARLGALSFVLVASVVSLNNYFFDEHYHRDDNRAAGRFLTQNAHPEDVVIASTSYTVKNLQHYYRGDNAIVAYSEEAMAGDPTLGQGRHGLVRDRFWLFLRDADLSDLARYLPRDFESRFVRDVTFTGPGVNLILYQREPSIDDASRAGNPASPTATTSTRAG